jgi:CubicO group peptidase (beta-lactamase class C family)
MHYVVLALVVSRLSGVAFEDFIQQNILTPVGMKHTYYNSFTALQTGLCSDAYSSKGVNMTHCAANFNLTNLDPACFGTPESIGWWTPTDGLFIAGAGAVSSNAQDMALWLQELSPRAFSLPPL